MEQKNISQEKVEYKETEFSVLMYCGQYVDVNLLEKGIYVSNKPFLYEKKATIDDLKYQASMMIDMLGKTFISESYIKNLEKCELVRVSIEQYENMKKEIEILREESKRKKVVEYIFPESYVYFMYFLSVSIFCFLYIYFFRD